MKEEDCSSLYESEMAASDFCRLCQINMKVAGVHRHSLTIFEKNSRPVSISERLRNIGLTVVQEAGRSDRCCQRCVATLSRLERDLPVFRRWESEFGGATCEVRATSLAAIPVKIEPEPTPLETLGAPPKQGYPHPASPGGMVTSSRKSITEVIISYPSKTVAKVCDPEDATIVNLISRKKWKGAAKKMIKHKELFEEIKNGVLKVIDSECARACSPKGDFMLWKSSPEDLKSFSFSKLESDLRRLAPFFLSIVRCVTNESRLATCVAASVALRGRQPRMSAFAHYLNTILQHGGAKKSVFNWFSKMSITTSHQALLVKRQEFAATGGADASDLKRMTEQLLNTQTAEVEERREEEEELCDAFRNMEDLCLSGEGNETVEQRPTADDDPVKTVTHMQDPPIDSIQIIIEAEDTSDPPEDISTGLKEKPTDHQDINDFLVLPATRRRGPDEREVHCCDQCGKIFSSKQNLKRHLNIHTQKNPFLCDQCGNNFHTLTHLKSHMRIHTGDKHYTCKYRGKGHSHPGDLKIHSRTHTGEKPYSCKHCEKSFKHSTTLKYHVRTHTGEARHFCKYCKRRFRTRHVLKRHVRIHTGEKPYFCTQCGKSFTQQASLNSHMVVHTGEKPYTCKRCGWCFSLRIALTKHMAIHTTERPFSCKQCGKNFREKSRLKTHLTIHSREKPFFCVLCSKSFHLKRSLKIHMRTHTEDRPSQPLLMTCDIPPLI